VSVATATDSIRVFLVEDEQSVRDGMRRSLESAGVAVAGDARDSTTAARQLPDQPVDVVLMHTNVGIGDVTRAAAGSAVIAVSDTAEPDAIVSMLAAGAHSYLLNDESLEETAAAVARAAASGENLVSPRISKLVMARLRELEPSAPPAPLTARELDVLRGLSDGLETEGIAASLDIGIGTVRDDVAAIRMKLGVTPSPRFAR
jgi:DNA-binding NarL/FixJ family response regulator